MSREQIASEMLARAECLPESCDWSSVVAGELRAWAAALSQPQAASSTQAAHSADGLASVRRDHVDSDHATLYLDGDIAIATFRDIYDAEAFAIAYNARCKRCDGNGFVVVRAGPGSDCDEERDCPDCAASSTTPGSSSMGSQGLSVASSPIGSDATVAGSTPAATPSIGSTGAVDALRTEFRHLYFAYVRLLESGRDRIRDLGGECDPVDVMERTDPYLIQARRALGIAQPAQQGERGESA